VPGATGSSPRPNPVPKSWAGSRKFQRGAAVGGGVMGYCSPFPRRPGANVGKPAGPADDGRKAAADATVSADSGPAAQNPFGVRRRGKSRFPASPDPTGRHYTPCQPEP